MALGACAPDVDTRVQALDAYCTALVNTAAGPRMIDVESDYLPHVVNCENGAADQAALEAQAVAARSYLYYRLDRTGDIGDGQSDQVYTCARMPGPQHAAAAAATAGIVLRYPPDTAATQVAAFYVAGAFPDPVTCVGGANDPTGTERYVTYNEGRSGTDVIQTTLGLVNPSNHANRGCMSQNGSDCLSSQGRTFDEILRFYYGEDIVIERAVGPCVPEPMSPDAGADAGDGGTDLDGGCSSAAGSLGLTLTLTLTLTLLRPRPRRRLRSRRCRRSA
ncbi:MAG: hypothetical protein F9K40_14315 [Kofleriaceae bacterium]|nr:MAG: hypothetical protein F9K40_14315 [Kofleriaceae bacterium]MBZ0232388.1 hypothetical protein [Kofleriaceae bacterium]